MTNKKKYDLILFKLKFFIDGLRNNNYGSKHQIEWLDREIRLMLDEYTDIVGKVKSQPKTDNDWLDCLPSDDIYKCAFSHSELCEQVLSKFE